MRQSIFFVIIALLVMSAIMDLRSQFLYSRNLYLALRLRETSFWTLVVVAGLLLLLLAA